MVRKHIPRDYSNHVHSKTRPDWEHIVFECFSYDPTFTEIYAPYLKNVKDNSNCSKTSWNSLTCYRSKNLKDPMKLTIPFSVLESGEYRIDVLYEQSNYLCRNASSDYAKYDTGKNLIGTVKVENVGSTSTTNKAKVVTSVLDGVDYSNVIDKVSDGRVKFSGENNFLKRTTLWQNLSEGSKKLTLSIPHNCYFYGVIIRKIKRFWGDNLDSAGSNLAFTESDLSISHMVDPSELNVTVYYDDAFECYDYPSGFYMQYADECNLWVRDDNGNEEIIFGGYISTIEPDDNNEELTIHCADRLIDGQNRYILDELVMQKGTEELKENEYIDGMEKSFKTYAHLLQYLCNSFETTLRSNIDKHYTVDGEKFHDGIIIKYNKKNAPKKISASNGILEKNKNSILLRNKSNGKKKQVFNIYDASKNAKKPPEFTKYPYLHITYGLGNPKKEDKSKTTETVDTVNAAAQKFTKCGVSQDGKYVMGIGQVSSAKSKGIKYSQIYKSVFKNKCPHCGKATLRWDSCRSDTKCIYTWKWNGTKGSWHGGIPETEITCTNCDSDYDSVTGWEKDSPWKRLTQVGKRVTSSKAEQTKLHKGEMVAVPTTNVDVTADDIFDAIWQVGKQYKYQLRTTSTFKDMEKSGKGDCHAFSDLISKQLKKYKVNHKIVQYSTSESSAHRSVLYLNEKGKWVDYPYKKHGWHGWLYPTAKSTHAHAVYTYKAGGRINQAKFNGSTTSTQTIEVTTTTGYDKDAPFKAYLKITYSTKQDFDAKKEHLYIDFTLDAKSNYKMTGLEGYWINNATRQSTTKNIVDLLNSYHSDGTKYYLQSIQFVAPAIKTENENDKLEWYTDDKQTHDNSSCKMDLYQIVLDDNQGANPSKLNSCGKSLNDLLKHVVEETGYLVDINYGRHRCDDVINFRVNNQIDPVYEAHEGNDNNILDWGNITYSPVNDLFNRSVAVFKGVDDKYHYVDTRDIESIFKYHEQTTLQSSTESIGEKEAYYNAVNSDKYNPEHHYTYTITVPNYPNVRLGELVKVVANSKKLNSVLAIQSIKVSYSIDDMPRIQTELGLGELSPEFKAIKQMQKLRASVKEESTLFTKSAIPVRDETIYEWDF